MKGYGGVEVQLHAFNALITLTLDVGVWSASCLNPLCTQGNSCQYPVNRRLTAPQNLSQCFGEENYLLPLLGIKPQFLSQHNPLHQLNYPSSNQLPKVYTLKTMTVAELTNVHTQSISDDYRVNNHQVVTAILEYANLKTRSDPVTKI
jgi:hypothetical protein